MGRFEPVVGYKKFWLIGSKLGGVRRNWLIFGLFCPWNPNIKPWYLINKIGIFLLNNMCGYFRNFGMSSTCLYYWSIGCHTLWAVQINVTYLFQLAFHNVEKTFLSQTSIVIYSPICQSCKFALVANFDFYISQFMLYLSLSVYRDSLFTSRYLISLCMLLFGVTNNFIAMWLGGRGLNPCK